MAKLRMKKIELIALQTDSKKIIELLQRRGVVEVCRANDELPGANVAAVINDFERHRFTVEQALDILEQTIPEKVPLTEMFGCRKELETDEFGKKATELEKSLSMAGSILRSKRAIADYETEISRLNVRCDTLKPWETLDIPLNFKGTPSSSAFIGSFPTVITAEALESRLSGRVSAEVISSTKGQTNMFILCMAEDAADIGNELRKNGFVQFSETDKRTPKEIISDCTEEKKRLEAEIEKEKAAIISCADNRMKLKFTADYLQMRKDKYEVLNSLGFTDNTFVLTGYIPEKYVSSIQKEIEKKFTVSISITDPAEDEDVPVLLENGSFSAPVEGITKMYAMPGKKDVDPTPVMSFFYYLLFGMMLSDAGYGLLMVIGTTIALKKFKLESTMQKTLRMFRNCGISTVFWGAMFGSWFGDIIQVVAREFFKKEIVSTALWFQPLDDPIKLLLFSFGIGILHLFLGVAVSGKMAWDEGRKLDAFMDTIPIYLLITGVAPLAASILTSVPSVLKNIGKYLLIAGLVLLILTQGRSSRSIFGKFFGGLYAVYNVATGWLGDILSYSRLLALGLATGCIASVINLIGVMPQSTAVKAIVLTVVFIVGHTANLAINLLGAYVHTDRLQFVELFSKFYTGGGREFSPLAVNTKYIKFKEENINE